MASSLIHMAVANEINMKLKRDSSCLLIGSIAPDISKLVGETKKRSHFLTDDTDIPNIELFLKKYRNKMNDVFVLGYYIHLYTDYLWYKYFTPEIYHGNLIKKLNGDIVKCSGRMITMYIYNDYTNLNMQLIDKYSLDLKIFYNEIPKMENIIKEIPMHNIKIIIDKTGEIVSNSKNKETMTIDMEKISNFINLSVKLILANLEELGIK